MKLKKHIRRLLLINAILIFICAGLITRDSSEDPEMDLPAIHIFLNDCTLEEIHDGATGIPYEGNTLDLDGKEYTNVRGQRQRKFFLENAPAKLSDQASQSRLCAWHAPGKEMASHRQLCRRLHDAQQTHV